MALLGLTTYQIIHATFSKTIFSVFLPAAKIPPIPSDDIEAYRRRFNDSTSKIVVIKRGEREIRDKLKFNVELCKKP
ncbi:MAG: hypothetical protein ACLUKN_02265 [Bacilli bacterium]